MAVVEVGGVQYHIENRLKKAWDRIKDGKLKKADDDRVYVVDGRERSGKSVFALQQSAYIDPSIIHNTERICFNAEEFLKAIRETESSTHETKVIIFDEAFRGLSSRGAISKTNKVIIQALMEMGQKNLVVFIVLPSFFMLDSYPAILRSHSLIHIWKERFTKRRGFKVYNYQKKAKLYDIGMKKGWGYKFPTYLKGRFSSKYPGGSEFEALYRDKKRKSLETMDIEDKKQVDRKAELRKEVLKTLKEQGTLKKAEKSLKDRGIWVSHMTISRIANDNAVEALIA